ncbi:sulfurtransferase complex subunit TusB [Enterovibrio sp. 27052020O]|uniref:sulfurtransferase complex subunit TusB n=1 Tax=Enterovibrio sp. 27052020O TaxID=3241166 RepID=UPI00388EAE46
MLHTVSSSPFSSPSLGHCLRYAEQQSEILLIEDAVIAAIDCGQWQQPLTSSGCRIYVLREDLVARGINHKITKSFEVVDMNGFVGLTERHVKQMKW